MAKEVWDIDHGNAMNITYSLTYPVISSLEICLCSGCLKLIEFEQQLVQSLDEACDLENVEGYPSDWNSGCQHHWNHVKAVLRRIHRIEAKLFDAIDSSHPQVALKLWEELMRQEARLAFALGGLHSHATHLNEAAGKEWNVLVIMVASHRKIIQTNIQKIHNHLQSWVAQGPLQEISVSNQKSLWGGEGVDDMCPNTDDWEFDQAAIEIEEEQHQSLGMIDGMKALFMWVEAPSERVLKSHKGNQTLTHEIVL